MLIIFRRPSPTYEAQEDYNPDEPKEDDSEARSVFVSQLAARLTARDLGYFFEDKLGEGTVMDSRIVTDRLSRRSKGCASSLPRLFSRCSCLWQYWIRRVPVD
jgi:RNA-binding protein 39